MGVLQPPVDPGDVLARQLRRQLAGREQDLAEAAAERVAVDVDVIESVVGADLLQLPERLLERLPVPQADVADGVLVGLDLGHREDRLRIVGAHVDRIEAEGSAREVDVALQVGLLEGQLVGFDHEALDGDRQHHADHQHGAEKGAGQREHQPGAAGRDYGIGGEREQDREDGCTPKREAGDVDRGVAGAEHGTRGLGQEPVAVQDVARRPGEQEQERVRQQVVEHGARRHDPDARPVADQPAPAVGAEQQHGRREGEHRDRVLDPVEERQREQIKADVAAVERVGLAERLRPEEADERIPTLGEAEAHDQRRSERGQELERPDQAGRRHAGDLSHGAGRLDRADQVDPAREQAQIDEGVDENDAGRRGEQGEPDQQQAPEDLRKAHRLEPEQIREPAEHGERRDQQRDHQPQDPGGGEEAQKAAHGRGHRRSRRGRGRSPDLSITGTMAAAAIGRPAAGASPSPRRMPVATTFKAPTRPRRQLGKAGGRRAPPLPLAGRRRRAGLGFDRHSRGAGRRRRALLLVGLGLLGLAVAPLLTLRHRCSPSGPIPHRPSVGPRLAHRQPEPLPGASLPRLTPKIVAAVLEGRR